MGRRRDSAFLAIEQTAGRGRHGRHWVSQKGGMYLSVLLRPSLPVNHWFGLCHLPRHLLFWRRCVASLPIIYRLLICRKQGLKWPNDVIVAGGKISGILLEVEGQGPDCGKRGKSCAGRAGGFA